MEVIEQRSIRIGSTEVLVSKIDNPIVIENLVQSPMETVKIDDIANVDKSKTGSLSPSTYYTTKVVSFGLQ